MMTPEMVDEMNLDKSLAFYKDRFSDASDFTFVFVGSFDLPTMKPLVERYLGGLPATHRKENVEGRRHEPADRRRREAGRQGHRAEEPRPTSCSPGRSSTTRSSASRSARWPRRLEIRLRESLREDLGGTYSVSASAGYSKIPARGIHDLRSISAAAPIAPRSS